jgi:hypothetical protein
MKKHLKTIFMSLRTILLAAITAAMIFGPTTVMAATNTANWDIGGSGQTAATITINAYAGGSVTLTKLAFLTDGTPLADGAVVPADTEVRFILYVENTNAGFAMTDISLSDTLTAGDFTMTSTDFSYITTAGTGLTPAAIYTAVTGGGASTATFGNGDGDIASYVGTTVNVGTTGGDSQMDVAANSTWAIIFNAEVNQ